MITNKSIITASSYLSMLLLGLAGALIGAAARNIGLSAYEISLMIMMQNLGFMLSVMVTGALADSYPKPRILMLGSLILAAAFFTFYSTGVFNWNLAIMFTIGIGIGTYEGVTDALLIELHPSRASLHININHFFVTFGSILITVYLIFIQMNWRNSIIQAGVIVLGLAIVFAMTRFSGKKINPEPYLARMKILTRDKVIVIFFFVTALVVGIEAGTIGILTTYLMDLRAFTQVTSKIGLVVFLVGMAIGRILVGIFAPQNKINQIMVSLFGFALVSFSLLYFIDLEDFTYVTIFLAGLSLSALLPLILTKAGLIYQEMAGTVLGSIKVAIPIGGIVLPLVMSFLVRNWNFKVSLLVFPVSLLIAFGLITLTTSKRINPGDTTHVS